jgi:uncharacterized protein involved in type VI secretion and phage assembly
VSGPRPDGDALRHFGVYPAIVTDIVDPSRLGRIELRFPWLGGDGASVRAWATLCSPYADDDQGLEVLPSVGSQVVVAFEAGDLRRPYILGACWNGREALPEAPAASNDRRLMKTRSGSKLEFDDTVGASKVTLSMSSGHTVILDDAAQLVRVEHSNGCVVILNVAGQIQIQANSSVDITAPVLNVHAPVANFDGIVNCTTVVCSTGVVSPSYTPGAGNIW